jgi:sugar fermentation stimulation protein A
MPPSDAALIRARFLRRYRRFLADVDLDGTTVTVHVPNTGSMATVLHPGLDAWLRPASATARLPYTLVLLGLPGGHRALVDTAVPNRIVADAIAAGRIEGLRGQVTREVRIDDHSRCDLVVDDDRGRTWVEIKNCTQAGAVPGRCDFPDAVTERGARHLAALSARVAAGDRAVQFYCLGRTDCDGVGVAATVDPAYAAAVRAAAAAGVRFLASRAILDPNSIRLGAAVPVTLPGNP